VSARNLKMRYFSSVSDARGPWAKEIRYETGDTLTGVRVLEGGDYEMLCGDIAR
jgi:hypothetical protein